MPFKRATTEDVTKESIELDLPDRTWLDEDEKIFIRPYFDYFAQVTAQGAAYLEEPDGWVTDAHGRKTKPKTKQVYHQDLYYQHLMLNHIVKSTLREPDGKTAAPSVAYLTLLGRANLDYFLDVILTMQGLPAGGFQTERADGTKVTFRPASKPDSGESATDVRPSEHADSLESVSDNQGDGVDVPADNGESGGVAKQNNGVLVAAK